MSRVRFWSVGNSIEALQAIMGLMDRRPPAYDVDPGSVDTTAAAEFYANNDPDPLTGLKEPFPESLIQRPMRLVISDPTFDQDYVYQGGIFISKRLRQIFDLDPRSVQYIRPDTTGSSERVIAQDYKWMSVLAYRNAIDLERSEPFLLPPPHQATAIKAMKHVVFRDDFESDVPLFYDPNHQGLFATDEFAEKVLRAGATAIQFYDFWSPRDDPKEIRVKSL